ncbi:MAG: hypothetical protein WDA41_10620 [Candidatus Neomarinimicrobiota bacterium]
MNAPTAYYDEKHRVVAVIHGLSDKWISARGRHRVKSPSLPPRDTQEEAQADLDAYADGKGWEIVPQETECIREVPEPDQEQDGENTSLTTTETKSFAQCEQVIAKGMHTFVEVGNALLTIRDGRLYRDKYATFEAYCVERWEMKRRYANYLIASAQVVERLGTIVPILPATETQARPLTTIPMEQVGEVWQEAIETAPKDKNGKPIITAKHVEETVKQWKEADEPYAEPDGFDSQAEGLKIFAWVRRRAEEWPREYAEELSGILSQLAQEVLE